MTTKNGNTYVKTLPNSILRKIAMNKRTDKNDNEVVVTLLSYGSSNLFKDNSLTLFANKLYTRYNLIAIKL